jgi:glycosyltransferase involved in cell wall biosynthesis
VAGLISVITVNLNDASGLEATARSVAAQDRPPDQWIVVDGGSTDGSLEVIDRFAPWIDSWTSGADRGVYDAMNRGMAQAHGHHLIFMNAGDRFAGRDVLARVAATLRRSRGPDLLFGGTILEFPSGRRLYRPPRPGARLRFGLPAYHQATVIRRAAHLVTPYDLELSVSADYGAIATLLTRGATSACLNQPIAIRACRPDSLSERATARRFADFISVQRKVLRLRPGAVAVHVARLGLIHLAYRLAMAAETRLPRRQTDMISNISKLY